MYYQFPKEIEKLIDEISDIKEISKEMAILNAIKTYIYFLREFIKDEDMEIHIIHPAKEACEKIVKIP